VTQIAIGALLAGAIAAVAYRVRALSPSGALAAFVVGTAIFGAGGWPGAAVLFAFFIPSTLLSRVGSERKRSLGGGGHGPRGGWQVLANGGVAAICASFGLHAGAPLAAAFAGAFAAASADTWATEIGVLAKSTPRSILTLRPVTPGMSGGVTRLGLLASVAGACCVAIAAARLGLAPFWSVAAGGVAGALADSVLGASLQALRWCPRCARECETRRHDCGGATELRRGEPWMGNDAVNLVATLCGAVVTTLIAR
jgi:uncharacterized protein (TIGR00297 family)